MDIFSFNYTHSLHGYFTGNRPISQIPQCIRQTSHNAPFCNRNVHMCAHFCQKMVHCGIWDRCIMGFVRLVYRAIVRLPSAWASVKLRAWQGSMHYCDIIMGAMASQITSLTVVYSIVHSGGDQRKHQSSASLAFVRGIPRWPVNSPHKWPVTRKLSPFDDVIMEDVQHSHNKTKQNKAISCNIL